MIRPLTTSDPYEHGEAGRLGWAVGAIGQRAVLIGAGGWLRDDHGGELGWATVPEMPADDDMAGWDAWAASIRDQVNAPRQMTPGEAMAGSCGNSADPLG